MISNKPLLFTDKLRASKLKCPVRDFIYKIHDIAFKLEILPDQLMAVIDLETGGTFDPSITNSLGYTGLIQFGSVAAKEVGSNTSELRGMDACKQLDYVYRYLKKYKGRMVTLYDLYLAIFFPVAIGKPLDWILRAKGLPAEKVALWNPLFDTNNDNKLQVWEIKDKLLSRIPTDYKYIV